jgi:CheY-like chemotaxis protein
MTTESRRPSGPQRETHSDDSPSGEELLARIRELEALCVEAYVAAVEHGLPQPLLNRLWTIAVQGRTPDAYDVDLPLRTPGRTPAVAPASIRQDGPPAIPDISLTDRPKGPDGPPSQPLELKALPHRRTVLVVDDDPMMLEVLGRILHYENYTLLKASDGQNALAAADRHGDPIDLLITDYAMPEMHGRELANRMRERNAGIKVLYQTGFSDMLFEDRVELEEGSAFVEKPFTARGLREAARLILFGSLNPR